MQEKFNELRKCFNIPTLDWRSNTNICIKIIIIIINWKLTSLCHLKWRYPSSVIHPSFAKLQDTESAQTFKNNYVCHSSTRFLHSSRQMQSPSCNSPNKSKQIPKKSTNMSRNLEQSFSLFPKQMWKWKVRNVCPKIIIIIINKIHQKQHRKRIRLEVNLLCQRITSCWFLPSSLRLSELPTWILELLSAESFPTPNYEQFL